MRRCGGDHGKEAGHRERKRGHDDARLANSPSARAAPVLRMSDVWLHGSTVPSADETPMNVGWESAKKRAGG
jgi:hypothetical protein